MQNKKLLKHLLIKKNSYNQNQNNQKIKLGDDFVYSNISFDVTFSKNSSELIRYDFDDISNNLDKIDNQIMISRTTNVKDLLTRIIQSTKNEIHFDFLTFEIKPNAFIQSLSIYDLTPYLNCTVEHEGIPSPHSYAINKYNNSIAHTTDNNFIMLYRFHWKGNYTPVDNKLSSNNINSLWHHNPYGMNNNFNFVFNCLGKSNLKYENNKFIVVDDSVSSAYLIQEDPRIFKNKNGKINIQVASPLFFNNIFGRHYDGEYIRIIQSMYNLDENQTLKIENKLVSGNICKNMEKNWTMYEYNDELYFLYSITDQLIIKYSDENTFVNLPVQTFFSRVKNNSNDNILFSGGSPAINYFKFSNLKIALGHVKVHTAYAKINKIIKESDYNYTQYVYYMFFYTFDPANGEVYSISEMFIPTCDINDSSSHVPYLMVFPMALIEWDDKYIVSYGEGDIRCKILTINKEDVSKMLKDIRLFKSEKDLKYMFYIGKEGVVGR